MKTKPILFQGDMVRAILDGRKTQTRRIVKPQSLVLPSGEINTNAVPESVWRRANRELPESWGLKYCCPYGQPGDLLWVRESHKQIGPSGVGMSLPDVMYADHPDYDIATKALGWRSVPSIHMNRWASRLTLEITDVRVERVLDISRGDAMEEGCPFPNMAEADPVGWFANLWQSINGQDSWDANPWVWVVEFRAIHVNVDDVLTHKQRR